MNYNDDEVDQLDDDNEKWPDLKEIVPPNLASALIII